MENNGFWEYRFKVRSFISLITFMKSFLVIILLGALIFN